MARYTQAQADALRQAIATGTRSVMLSWADRSENRTFHSLDEMRSLLTEMEQDLALDAGAPPQPRQYHVTSRKGF